MITERNKHKIEQWIKEVPSHRGRRALRGCMAIFMNDDVANTFKGIVFGANTTNISMPAASTTAISITGAMTGSVLSMVGASWATGFGAGAIYITRTIASQAASSVIERRDITATITGGNYLMGSYNTYTTGASFGATGFIIGHYSKITVAHLLQESYAVRGQVCITGAQPGNTSNQHIGVFGAVEISAVALASADTGGCYGVLGTTNLAVGGTADQPLLAGYFDSNPLANITGLTCAVRARMQGYTDYGLDILCQTTNNVAGIRILTTDSAVLDVGIEFSHASGHITNAMEFTAGTSGLDCLFANAAITAVNTSHALQIDIEGTPHYIPVFSDLSWGS